MKGYFSTGIEECAISLYRRGWSEDNIDNISLAGGLLAVSAITITPMLLARLTTAAIFTSSILAPLTTVFLGTLGALTTKVSNKLINISSINPQDKKFTELVTAEALTCATPRLPYEMGYHISKYLNKYDAINLTTTCRRPSEIARTFAEKAEAQKGLSRI